MCKSELIDRVQCYLPLIINTAGRFFFVRKLILKSKHVLAERGEYASAYGAELRSVFLRLPQYDRLAALGHE